MERLINKLFYILIPVLLGLTIVFSVYNSQKSLEASEQLRSANEQLIEINNAQKHNLEVIQADIKDLKETIFCLAEYYNYTDKTDLVITNYSPCIIERDGITLSTGTSGSTTAAPTRKVFRNSSPTNTTPQNQPSQQEITQPQSVNSQPGILGTILNFIRSIF